MRPKLHLTAILAALTGVALVLVPVAGAGHQFTDVPNEHPFHTEISIFKDTNITSGCTATTFCPSDYVRRQAMAAFVDRALGLAVRPGESALRGIPGSRVAMLDDGSSLVRTNSGGLELGYGGQRALRIESANPVPNIIGGGSGNAATSGDPGGVVGGGGGPTYPNILSSGFTTIAGGLGNRATGWGGSVGGGFGNQAASYSSVPGGWENVASGAYAAVPGGYSSTASGWYSLAAGRRAKATHNGSFVWADGADADFASEWANEFSVRAGGGVRLMANVGVGLAPIVVPVTAGRPGSLLTQGPIRAGVDNATGCALLINDDVCFYDEQNGTLSVRNFAGTAYTSVKASAFTVSSSASAKKDIARLGRADAEQLRETLDRLPLYRYRYRNEPDGGQPHTGVIAERSPALILSRDRKSVNLYDYVGLTAGATKALSRRVRTLERRNRALGRTNGALRRENRALADRVAAIEKTLAELGTRR